MPLSTGQVLHNNRYRIDALLGQGGMGAVYRAWDTSLDMPVAIKENLDASSAAQRQFSREARILARLSHPSLPRVTDHFFIPGQGQYLVMDFVEGEDLQAMLDRFDLLPEPQVLTWISQICDALAYLHSQPSPIIHRDIKPANIKIRPDGRAMLVDFGIAKVYDPQLATTIGAKAVTPGYSPPEQYGGGSTDARSDIYALGATLYHLLTGQKPPESVQRMVGEATMPSPRRLNQQISPMVEQVILKAIEVTTERRFQSVGELRTALTQPLPGTVGQKATRPAAPDQTKLMPQRKPAVALPRAERPSQFSRVGLLGGLGLVVVVLVVGALAVSGVFRGPRPTPTPTVTVLPTDVPTQMSAEKTPDTATPAPPTNVIKIGLDVPMTGDIPYIGTQSQRAAEMRVAEINDVGGLDVGGKKYTIELVIEDNEFKAESATAAATKLIIQDQVLAIVGPQASKQAVPTGAVCNENETPMISPWSTNPNTTLDRPWVFRGCFLDPFQGPVVANFITNEFGFTKAAVLYDVASDYPKGLAENFRDAWEDLHGAGSVVAYESFTTGDADFSAQLTKIKGTDAQVLFTPQYYNEVPLIVKQAQALGLSQIIVGSDSWGDPMTLELCGDACEGLFFSTHYAAEGATGATKAFIDAYEELHGETPGDVAALTWDAMGLVLQAVQNTGGLSGDLAQDRAAVKDELARIKDFAGITGNMTFTPEGDPIKCAVIVKIQGGKFTFYDSACP